MQAHVHYGICGLCRRDKGVDERELALDNADNNAIWFQRHLTGTHRLSHTQHTHSLTAVPAYVKLERVQDNDAAGPTVATRGRTKDSPPIHSGTFTFPAGRTKPPGNA
jgi:hypothetical protein